MEGQKAEVEAQLQQTEQTLRQAEQQAEEAQQLMHDTASATAVVQLADMEAKTQALEQELADTHCMYEDSVQAVQDLRYGSRPATLPCAWQRHTFMHLICLLACVGGLIFTGFCVCLVIRRCLRWDPALVSACVCLPNCRVCIKIALPA